MPVFPRPRTKVAEHSEYLSSKQLCLLMPFLSQKGLHTAISRNRPNCPPYYKVGGRLVFKRSEVEEWVQRHRIAPPDEQQAA